MASITIRNLDEDIKTKLRVQAAQNNRSMEEEARIILRQALAEAESEPNIALRILLRTDFMFRGLHLKSSVR